MSKFRLILLGFLSVIFSSCHATDNIDLNSKKTVKILEEVDLTEKVKSSQGAEITLLKASSKCRLVYNVYGETGQEEYNFDFKKDKILQGNYLSYNYRANKDGVIDLANLTDKDFILVKKAKASQVKFDELKKFLNKNIIRKNCN